MTLLSYRASTFSRAARLFALIALAFVPLSTAITNIACGLFALCALLSPEVWREWRAILRDALAVAALLLFLALLLSVIYSAAAPEDALSVVSKYRKLLLLPLLARVFATSDWTARARYALLAALTLLTALSCTNFLGWTAIGGWYDARDPIKHGWVFKNHITAGIFLAPMLYLTLRGAARARRLALKLALYLLALLVFVDEFFILQGRTGQVIAVLFCLIEIARCVWAHRGKSKVAAARALTLLAVCAVLLSYAYHAKDSRLADTPAEISAYRLHDQVTSAGLRLEFYRKSLELFRQRPLAGYGAGSVTPEFIRLTSGKSGAAGTVTPNPHNEFLMMAVQLGAVGVGLFIYLLVQIARRALTLTPSARELLLAYWFTFTLGCLANSLLLDFSEGSMLILLTGVLSGARRAPADISRN